MDCFRFGPSLDQGCATATDQIDLDDLAHHIEPCPGRHRSPQSLQLLKSLQHSSFLSRKLLLRQNNREHSFCGHGQIDNSQTAGQRFHG